jgi:hypothetical protein
LADCDGLRMAVLLVDAHRRLFPRSFAFFGEQSVDGAGCFR